MTSFKGGICERCLKHVTEHSIHSCTPTKGWRKMEAELETLRQQRDELLKAIREVLDDAEECSDADDWTAMCLSLEAYHNLCTSYDDTLAKVKGE